jgi:excisionase family DNA binding protein
VDKPERAPNIVPRGAVRLSEAFETLYRHLTPEWKELSDRCVQWDETSLDPQADLGEDPYRIAVVATDRAEMMLRWALKDGDLRAYVHNVGTGIDLELDRHEWLKTGEEVGLNSDYTGPRMPGPDCALDGVRHPIFLIRHEFEQWLGIRIDRAAPTLTVAQSHRSDPTRVLTTWAFSVEEVIARTGLSKTKLYEEIEQGNLRARKSGARTLILESDLDQFLNNLQLVLPANIRSRQKAD